MSVDELIKIHEYIENSKQDDRNEFEEYLSYIENKMIDIDNKLSLICKHLDIDDDIEL